MCGIAGFISKNKKYDAKSIVSRMLLRLRHRGPDQKGVYSVTDGTAIGMVRLSIIDQEKHQIPYRTEDGRYVIAYNGEIYNHDDLRNIHKTRYSFATASDAETVLYHFAHKGAGSFNDYNGMYAFGVYDEVKRELYIVRDRAGEKPVYYIKTGSFFAFASEIKALLEVVKPVFNKDCLSYEAYEFNTGEDTVFKDIHAVLPGEYIKVDSSLNVTKHVYWKIWDNLIESPGSLAKTESKLTDLIVDAIELRTKNCVHRYGAFISGGIDSSLIACIAKPDYIYTCHYDMDGYDELRYAKLVAKKIKKELVIVQPDQRDFSRTREKIIYHLDTPCTWTSFSLWMLLERASKDIKVVLSGDGADEIFSGYHRYHLLNHDEQINKLKALRQYSYLVNRYYGSAVERYCRLVNRSENRYSAEVAKYLNDTVGHFFEKAGNDCIHSMGVTDFYTTMQELLQFGDRINMAFSVENRSPFLDYRLIQMAFSMSSKFKIREGTTKWIVKRIARKFIPMEIVERVDKRGFSAPINRWFGWDKNGKYDRRDYKNMVFQDWVKVFNVDTGCKASAR